MAITVILTANYLGRSISIRIKSLEDFSLLIMSIKTYIGFSKAPITQIMRKLENEQNFSRLGFLPSLNEKLDNGRDFYEAWCESLSEIRINPADTELLQAFAESLGGSDVNGQLENCALKIGQGGIRDAYRYCGSGGDTVYARSANLRTYFNCPLVV